MRNTTLINLLRTLQPVDFKQFFSFLSSPYFNTNPTVINLYNYLIKFHPDFQDNRLTQSNIISEISVQKPIQEGTLSNLMNQLSQCVRKFLIQQKLEKNKILNERLLFDAYAERKSKKTFNKLYRSRIATFEKKVHPDRFYFLEHYLALEKYYHFPITDRQSIGPEYMRKTVHNLDRFFVLSQLLLKIETNSRLSLLNEKQTSFFFDSGIEGFINALPEKEKPLYHLLQLVNKIQNDTTIQLINKALLLFKEQYLLFSKFNRKMILKVLINQMNKLFQHGNFKLLQEMYEFYKFGLDHDIMLFDKSLTIDDYLNIVTSASRTNNIDWSIQFINTHIQYIPLEDREQAKILANAIVHFDQGKFKEVSQTLIKNPFRNIKFGFRYKLLIMKGYIEQAIQNPNDVNWILKRLKVVDRNIQRLSKKSKDKNITLFLNFLAVTRKLLRILQKEEKISQQEFIQLISSYSPMISKNWLLQRINTLEQRQKLK